MKTAVFDGELSGPVVESGSDADIEIRGMRLTAHFDIYPGAGRSGGTRLVHVRLNRPVDIHWKDRFGPGSRKAADLWAEGTVLLPGADPAGGRKVKPRINLLEELKEGAAAAIRALVDAAGTRGISGEDLTAVSGLSREQLLQLGQALEAESLIRILTFSPLFVISQSQLDRLSEKILTELVRFHERHPDKPGLPGTRIQKKADLHPRILNLIIKTLSREGRIRYSGGFVSLPDFRIVLRPEDERIITRLEEMSRQGQIPMEPGIKLSRSLGITRNKLDQMIGILIERQKIVQAREGYIIHSEWMEEVIRRVRNSGKTEFSVADFKEMTGMSRKYAIPLLELLDQMGVTRRKGNDRLVLGREG